LYLILGPRSRQRVLETTPVFDGLLWKESLYTPATGHPTTEYTFFIDFLDRLEGSIRSIEGVVIVAGDFNAKSPA